MKLTVHQLEVLDTLCEQPRTVRNTAEWLGQHICGARLRIDRLDRLGLVKRDGTGRPQVWAATLKGRAARNYALRRGAIPGVTKGDIPTPRPDTACTEAMIVEALAWSGGEATALELSERCAVNRRSPYTRLAALARKGLVQRPAATGTPYRLTRLGWDGFQRLMAGEPPRVALRGLSVEAPRS